MATLELTRLPRTRFTGRQDEWARVWRAFQRTTQGCGHVVLVAGESGMGKSRFLEEFATQAREIGAVILQGGASDASGMPAYLPFLEAVGGYIQTAALEQLRAQVGQDAATLGTIFPEVIMRLGPHEPNYLVLPDQAQLRLYNAVVALLHALASTAPVVLLLDDLQWADAATWDLILHISRRVTQMCLLLVGAYRTDEIAENPAWSRAIVTLNRDDRLTTLVLAPLTPAEIAGLASDQLGAPLTTESVQVLHEHSEGNPFFAKELIRGWVESGALTEEAVAHPGETPALILDRDAASTLPESIVGAIRLRLAHLPTAIVDLLRMAAVVGRRFDSQMLATISGRDCDTIEEDLLRARNAQLVTPQAGTFLFNHDKVRECLYAEVSSARRQHLHLAIGLALEAQDPPAAPDHLAALAFHFGRSSDRAKGVQYALRAADHAVHAFAPAEALGHYRVAVSLLDPEDERRGAILMSLGDAAQLLGHTQEARTAFADAYVHFARHEEQEKCAIALRARALLDKKASALGAAHVEIETAFSFLAEDLPPLGTWLRRMYSWRAYQHVMTGDWQGTERLLREALTVVARMTNQQNRGMIHHLQGFIAYQHGFLDQALQEMEAARAIFHTSGPRQLEWHLGLLGLLSLAYSDKGRIQDALSCLHDLATVCAAAIAPPHPERRQVGGVTGSMHTLLALGWLSVGKTERATACYDALLGIKGELHWVLVDRVLGMIDCARKAYDAALIHLDRAETTATQEGLRPELAQVWMARANLDLAQGGRGSALRARDLLMKAYSLCRDLHMEAGASSALARAEAAVQRSLLPAGLSEREADVLRCVAAGMSNEEVARYLHLSAKTAANHLTAIFNKTGGNSRAAAASFYWRARWPERFAAPVKAKISIR